MTTIVLLSRGMACPLHQDRLEGFEAGVLWRACIQPVGPVVRVHYDPARHRARLWRAVHGARLHSFFQRGSAGQSQQFAHDALRDAAALIRGLEFAAVGPRPQFRRRLCPAA